MAWSLFQRQLRQFGPYEVLGQIGKGSAGLVFKARHRETGALVALKVLCVAEARDPISLKRFEQEFLASRSLNDPHIVRGLDFGNEGIVPYLVMEFVDGINLRSHLKIIGRLDETEALRIALQVARALHHAHRRGMIHRDVNPGNILLSSDGRARLTDFGLVKCLESGLTLTVTANALGTPCFMAPEQFDDAKRIDERCDVYGLAATLYMTITGEAPFNSRAYGTTVRKKLNGELIAPRQLIPELSLQVDWAIMRALSVSPRMRPASCSEFVRDLTGGNEILLEEPDQVPGHRGGMEGESYERPEVERRAVIRYPCRLERRCLAVEGQRQMAWEAEIRDISVKGLGLATNRWFDLGTVLALESQDNKTDATDSMMVRVVRSQAQASGQWLLGCQFAQNLDEEEMRALLAPNVPADVLAKAALNFPNRPLAAR